MIEEMNGDDLRFLGRVLADSAAQGHADRLCTGMLAMVHDRLTAIDTGTPVFDAVPLSEMSGIELVDSLRELFTLTEIFQRYGRTAIAAHVGHVLDVLIRYARAKQDEAALEYLDLMLEKAIENGGDAKVTIQ